MLPERRNLIAHQSLPEGQRPERSAFAHNPVLCLALAARRRETISGYLKAAGITVWRPGGWSRQEPPRLAMQVITDPAKPCNGMTTGSLAELASLNRDFKPENLPPKRKSNREDSKPAIEVITGFGVELRDPEGAKASPQLSACELLQEVI